MRENKKEDVLKENSLEATTSKKSEIELNWGSKTESSKNESDLIDLQVEFHRELICEMEL